MITRREALRQWIGTRSLSGLALWCLGWYVVAVVALHFLRPDLSPLEHRLSDYAIGPFGGLMTSAIVGLALAKLLLVLGLLNDGPRTWLARGGDGLLQLGVVGLVISAISTVELPGDSSTWTGVLGEAGRVLNVGSSLLAAVLFTMGFSLDDRWRPIAGRSLLLALAFGVEVVLLVLAARAQDTWGLVHRAYAATSVAWISSTAGRLWQVARS